MRCYIFCSSKIENYDFLKDFDFENSLIICADGGYKHAKKLGIKPNVWLGDGDSMNGEEINTEEKITYPTRKDNTDTDLAVELAISRGCDKIVILGGIGKRLDHEFSHFCLLKKICDLGASGFLIDEKNEITMKKDGFRLYPNDKKYISFFPYGGEVRNLSIKGLRYEASGINLECGKVQASSNCFDDADFAEITFDSGYLLVMRCSD